jgi:hypothetical protein
MIDWGDTLRESEQRAANRAIDRYEREHSLRNAIARLGTPHNPLGNNAIETTYTTSGDPYLRPDRTLIADGILGD